MHPQRHKGGRTRKRKIGRRLLATLVLTAGMSAMFGLGASPASAECACSSTSLCASVWVAPDGTRRYVVDQCRETGWMWGIQDSHDGEDFGYSLQIPIP